MLRNSVSFLILFSIVLTACDVAFTPDIEPLVIEEPGDQLFIEDGIVKDTSTEELSQGSVNDDDTVSEFISTDAIALCGGGLSWGDETLGMCLAPGGDTYFIWTDEGDVKRVFADTADNNQAIFRQAVEDRSSALNAIEDQSRSMLFEAGGLFLEVVALAPACTTIVLCVADIAAVMLTGSLLAESGSSIIDDIELTESATKRADYGYCRMMGGNDDQCRTSAGISNELDGD